MGWTGSKLRRYRNKHGITQADAADALNVSASTVSRWENEGFALEFEPEEEEALEALADRESEDEPDLDELRRILEAMPGEFEEFHRRYGESSTRARTPSTTPATVTLDWAYATFGLPTTACGAELREARQFSLFALHPDRFSTEAHRRTAHERTVQLGKAWSALEAAGRT